MKEKPKYSEDFKREAIALAIEHGNISQASRELGINNRLLQR